MAKVLLVEDDSGTADLVADCLAAEHHVVESVFAGEDALMRLKTYHYDLVILDWKLPDIEGVEILRRFRSQGGQAPVLMLTGESSINSKNTGFSSGADDYLTKPFHLSELQARIRALLRRPHIMLPSILSFHGLTLDIDSHSATRGNKRIELLPKEFALLELFFRNPDIVLSLETILERVWSSESETTPEAVRTCLQRLRKKIDLPGEESIIVTVYGVGYKMPSDDVH